MHDVQPLAELEPIESLAHPGRTMTEQEFEDWCDDQTWAEWVDGEVILMSAVCLRHGFAFGFLHPLVCGFVQHHKLGTVFAEPVQFRLPGMRRRRSPDLFFVAADRQVIIKDNVVDGAPDLVIEIVSPESEARDWREKYLEYESAGVPEYWIADPLSAALEGSGLSSEGRYRPLPEQDGRILSSVLPGFYLRREWLQRDAFPDFLDILREFGVIPSV